MKPGDIVWWAFGSIDEYIECEVIAGPDATGDVACWGWEDSANSRVLMLEDVSELLLSKPLGFDTIRKLDGTEEYGSLHNQGAAYMAVLAGTPQWQMGDVAWYGGTEYRLLADRGPDWRAEFYSQGMQALAVSTVKTRDLYATPDPSFMALYRLDGRIQPYQAWENEQLAAHVQQHAAIWSTQATPAQQQAMTTLGQGLLGTYQKLTNISLPTCDCGAKSTGAVDYGAGHSSWCGVVGQ